MTNLTMPQVLAFDRKLEPSDALMFSGNWDQLDDTKSWQAIELTERRNRAVKSNFKQEVLGDEEVLKKELTEPNLAWGDDASIRHDHDSLKLSFSLRVVGGLDRPSVCDKPEFENSFIDAIAGYLSSNFDELPLRYAYNIANGRFLWRNRVGALEAKIRVSHESLADSLVFDAFDYPLGQTTSADQKVATLANLIGQGLAGEQSVLLKIDAFVKLGQGQRVWPSQEMVLNSPKGEKSRHLFFLKTPDAEKHAAMHCEKIGNALRTIDDWYSNEGNVPPIAIEAYGSVTQKGEAHRSSKIDFRTLILKWLNNAEDKEASEEEKHFVVAMLIRGGVFGEKSE